MILGLIYQGLIIVLLLTFSFGPGFFALINTGIKHGYRPGAFLAVGIVVSDLFLCVLVCLLVHYGGINLLQSEKAQTFSAIIGGIILIVFGASYFQKHVSKSDTAIDIGFQSPHPSLIIIKGFFLNIFNPAVWFLWLGNVTAIGKTLQYSFVKMLIFFSMILMVTLLVEISKVYLAEKIKNYLTDRLMTMVNYITGTALVAFGLWLIYKHYF